MLRITTRNSTYLIEGDALVCVKGTFAGLIETGVEVRTPAIGAPFVAKGEAGFGIVTTPVLTVTSL